MCLIRFVKQRDSVGKGAAALAWSEAVAEAEKILAENGDPAWGKNPATTC